MQILLNSIGHHTLLSPIKSLRSDYVGNKTYKYQITSFPLVSPLSNHSTVTLRVVVLIPDTTAE